MQLDTLKELKKYTEYKDVLHCDDGLAVIIRRVFRPADGPILSETARMSQYCTFVQKGNSNLFTPVSLCWECSDDDAEQALRDYLA